MSCDSRAGARGNISAIELMLLSTCSHAQVVPTSVRPSQRAGRSERQREIKTGDRCAGQRVGSRLFRCGGSHAEV
eukprot:881724-Pleurochrysis_carterae.AAC.1